MMLARPTAAVALAPTILAAPPQASLPRVTPSQPDVPDREFVATPPRVPHSLLARSYRRIRNAASVALVCSTMVLGGCDYLDKLFNKRSKGTIEGVVNKPDAGQPPLNTDNILIGTGTTRSAARRAMWKKVKWFTSFGNNHNPLRNACFGKRIRFRPAKKVRCRKIKRGQHECRLIWNYVYCIVGRMKYKSHNPHR